MTLEQAKQLKSGDLVHHISRLNADKTPMRAKVTSIKTWKTRPDQIEVHVKRGMYEYAVFNEQELDQIR